MSHKNIPIYSEGEMVGGLAVGVDGSVKDVKFNQVGTERLGACAVNDLDFVLDLTPSSKINGAVGDHRTSLSEVAKRDEQRRMAALSWVHSISNAMESPMTPEGVASLSKRIERFIRTGE